MSKPNTLSLSLILSLGLVACGGGGGGDGSTTPVTPTSVLPTVSTVIPTSSYAAGSAELGGWTVLQQARALCGFGTLKQDTRLDAAALAHAKYLTELSITSGTSVLSHYETATSNPYYSGYYPWDRTVKTGYGNQVAEILEATYWNYTSGTALPTLEQRGADSMLGLMNSVYHLAGAMFDGVDVGFGADMRTVVNGALMHEEYRFGSLNGYQTATLKLGTGNVATYPCQGSSNIPPVFTPANESPNPFPSLTTMGTPIYLKVDPGQVLTVSASNSSIISITSGVAVPFTLLTHANDPNIDPSGHPYTGTNEVFVVPTSALASYAIYQVTLNGTIGSVPFSRSFKMSTGL